MDQASFSDLEYDQKKRKTRREKFLERMDGLIPWEKLESRIERHYPKAGRGRKPYALKVMLRIHCVQLFYNLSDPAMEDMLYEIESVRRFVGVKLTGQIPDETTILNFRHLLERHNLGTKLFDVINRHLADQGLAGPVCCGEPASSSGLRESHFPNRRSEHPGEQLATYGWCWLEQR